jgi:ribonuclease D
MAGFCGMESNRGYATLTKDVLAIEIFKDKKIQISNWRRRPLTKMQLQYAIGDVKNLLKIYEVLFEKIKNNYSHYRESMEERYGKAMITNLPLNAWKHIRPKIKNKNEIAMAMLKELCKFREEMAIKHNMIRQIILPDDFFKNILLEKPRTIDDFKKCFTSIKINRSLRKTIIEGCSKIFIDNPSTQTYLTEIKNKTMLAKYNLINQFLIDECKKMNISPSMVLNKFDLIAYLSNSEKLEDVFAQWKINIFGKKIKHLIRDDLL